MMITSQNVFCFNYKESYHVSYLNSVLDSVDKTCKYYLRYP
eukprot:SAG31_NODE_4726_length_3005_cov_6.928424_2_plen_41_part_00